MAGKDKNYKNESGKEMKYLLALTILAAPALAGKAPLPQMNSCISIDDMNITQVIRVVKYVYVAKTDYKPLKVKKKITDRIMAEDAR